MKLYSCNVNNELTPASDPNVRSRLSFHTVPDNCNLRILITCSIVVDIFNHGCFQAVLVLMEVQSEERFRSRSFLSVQPFGVLS